MREPREQLILDLLRFNWDNTNTYDLTPTINYGWFDAETDQPQITIPQPDEGPINGGSTGYSAIDPSGGNPHQTISGTIDIDFWAEPDDLDGATTDFPKQYLGGDADRDTGDITLGAIEEAKRIIRENSQQPTNPETGNQPVRTIAPGDATPVPEPDDQYLVHHTLPIIYIYGE